MGKICMKKYCVWSRLLPLRHVGRGMCRDVKKLQLRSAQPSPARLPASASTAPSRRRAGRSTR